MILPSKITRDAIRQADQFVEVGGDQQHADPAVAHRAQLVPDGGLRADVDATCRVRSEEHASFAGELAADDELLLVAPRQREGRTRRFPGYARRIAGPPFRSPRLAPDAEMNGPL